MHVIQIRILGYYKYSMYRNDLKFEHFHVGLPAKESYD